jgi:hypothetical protein
MVYDLQTVDTQISARSSVQQGLWELFNLSPIEDTLTRHDPQS